MGNDTIRGEARVSRRGLLAGLIGATLLAGRCGLRAEEASTGLSPWSDGDHARVRLIDGGAAPAGGGERLAGIQLELDPGYLTYWRSPGEAGVPPTISFAGSTNLKAAVPLFPAPGRYSEGGTEAIGYKDGVVFPVLVTPTEAGKAVDLKLAIDFGICERLCLPAKARAALSLGDGSPGPESGLVRDALARVPVPDHVGDSGALAVLAVDGTSSDDAVIVRVRSDGSDVPLLFAEAPEPWFVQAGEGLWMNGGTLKFPIRVLSRPADPAPLPLRLTLAGAERAIEVPVTLDAPPPRP